MHSAPGNDPNTVWWNQITGPVVMKNAIVTSLIEGKSIFLQIAPDVPWWGEIRKQTEQLLLDKEQDLQIQYCVPSDNETDPGRVLLKFSPDADDNYRETSSVSLANYIEKERVLEGQIVWITCSNWHKTLKWLNFCKQYNPKSIDRGLLVIEYLSDCDAEDGERNAGTDSSNNRNRRDVSLPRHMTEIDSGNFITEYDRLLFCSLLVSRLSLSSRWKKYVATLASILYGSNLEHVAEFIYDTDFHSDNLYKIAKDLNASRVIWRAQLQVVFPQIEEEQIGFIEKYHDPIKQALAKEPIIRFGNIVREPEDVDLAVLVLLCTKTNSDVSRNRLLHIPSRVDSERIHFLHRIRNEIAHMRYCTPQDLDILFEIVS
ncbi:MAG: hypothetical protein LBS75_07790 [Synergistaceae bacterium]|jgi:hypothetical protein|nr:hypothetical protein [Synergistaceae bacterium]